MTSENRDEILIRKFIESKKVLIADASASTRETLSQLFHFLGAKSNNIFLGHNYEQAERLFTAEKPHIVMA